MSENATTVLGAVIFFFILAGGTLLILRIASQYSLYKLNDTIKKLRGEQAQTNNLLQKILKKIEEKPNNSKTTEDINRKID